MKTVILFMALVFCSFSILAQAENESEEGKFRFGFNVGTNYSMVNPVSTPKANYEISNGIGFNLGILMDYSVNENFIISPKSELSFHNSSLDFINPNDSRYTYNILPVSLNIMTHFKYKIAGKKHEPYILAGPNFKIPLSQNTNSDTGFNTTSDFAIDFGIGLENKLKHFIFAPELRYSFGLLNINTNPALRSLNLHSILLVLNFK